MSQEHNFPEAVAIREWANISAINSGVGTNPDRDMYEQASRDLDAFGQIPEKALDSLVGSLNVLAEIRVFAGNTNYELLYRAMKDVQNDSALVEHVVDAPEVQSFITPEVEAKLKEYADALLPYAQFALPQIALLLQTRTG